MRTIILHSGITLTNALISSVGAGFDWCAWGTQLPESPADVLLVAGQDEKPIAVIQHAVTQDPLLSILLLVAPAYQQSMRSRLLFSPGIGHNVLMVSDQPFLDIRPIILQAAGRTAQKRGFLQLETQEPLHLSTIPIATRQFRGLLQQFPTPAVLTNTLGQLLSVNPPAESIFGQGTELGGSLFSIPAIQPVSKLLELLITGQPIGPPLTITLSNRSWDVIGSRVKNGVVDQFLFVFHDVTDRARQQARLNLVLEAMPNLSWTADLAGSFTYLSDRWKIYTGMEPAKGLETGWLSLVDPVERPRVEQQWIAAIQNALQIRQHFRLHGADGLYRWHLMAASLIKESDGFVGQWVGTFSDIDAQVLRNEELELRVTQRTAALTKSNAELEQFMHVSSHDLQEPIRKILTFAEMLESVLPKEVLADAAGYLQKIRATGERMSDALKSLVRFAELSRAEQMQPVDLQQLMSEVMVDLELRIAETCAQIKIEQLPIVQGSALQFHQLFYNLLGNALKFQVPGQQAQVSITCRKSEGNELQEYPDLHLESLVYEIIVQDNGIGFDENSASKIFDIFYRLHDRRKYAGSGIGLALCKKVVENHRGIIFARSSPGQGAAFFILLPANAT